MFSSVSTGLSRFEKGNHAISAFAGKSASAARGRRGQVVHFALQDAQGLATWVAAFRRSRRVFLNSRKMLSHHPAFSFAGGRLSLRPRELVDHAPQSVLLAAVVAWRQCR
jgi:hypothetical protein